MNHAFEMIGQISFGFWLCEISRRVCCWQWYNYLEESIIDIIKLSVDTGIDDLELEKRIFSNGGYQRIRTEDVGANITKYIKDDWAYLTDNKQGRNKFAEYFFNKALVLNLDGMVHHLICSEEFGFPSAYFKSLSLDELKYYYDGSNHSLD